MSKIKPLVEALTGIMGLLSFADSDARGLAGDNQTELETVWLPKAEAALAAAGYPLDDGPGREYVEAFNAHIRAQDARKAFPFTMSGTGRPARLLEMIRVGSIAERFLSDADGLRITLEYQVDSNVGADFYCASWASAVRKFWKLYRNCRSATDEVSVYLNVWTPDELIASIGMIAFIEGEIMMYDSRLRDFA